MYTTELFRTALNRENRTKMAADIRNSKRLEMEEKYDLNYFKWSTTYSTPFFSTKYRLSNITPVIFLNITLGKVITILEIMIIMVTFCTTEEI